MSNNRNNIDDELQVIISKISKKIKKEESSKEEQLPTPVEKSPFPYCPLPTDMCRVSPFFPMRQKDLNRRIFLEDLVLISSSWGEIIYTGPKLSVYEEDALVAILAVFDNINYRERITSNGKDTYIYEGSILPFLNVYCSGRHPSKRDYERFLRKLRLLASTNIEMKMYDRSDGERKKVDRIIGTSLIVYYKWDEDNKRIKIILNPYFYEVYINKRYTLLDASLRMKLKKPTSKALYRFIKSQRGKVWKGNYLTLAKTINLDTTQKSIYIKMNIQNAIEELKLYKILSKSSGFLKNTPDIVRLVII